MIDDFFYCVYLEQEMKGIFHDHLLAEDFVSSLGDRSYIVTKWFKTDIISF